jgi:transposase
MSEPALGAAEVARPPRSRAATRQRWVERFDSFPASGLSPAEFCAREGVSVASFYLWKRRLAAENTSPAPKDAAPRLLPVCFQEPAAPIELVLPGGTLVRIAAGADEATLRCLLQLLGVSPC